MVEQADEKTPIEMHAQAFIKNYMDRSEESRRAAGCNNVTKKLNGLILG